jgi:hypothetical protein
MQKYRKGCFCYTDNVNYEFFEIYRWGYNSLENMKAAWQRTIDAGRFAKMKQNFRFIQISALLIRIMIRSWTWASGEIRIQIRI